MDFYFLSVNVSPFLMISYHLYLYINESIVQQLKMMKFEVIPYHKSTFQKEFLNFLQFKHDLIFFHFHPNFKRQERYQTLYDYFIIKMQKLWKVSCHFYPILLFNFNQYFHHFNFILINARFQGSKFIVQLYEDLLMVINFNLLIMLKCQD